MASNAVSGVDIAFEDFAENVPEMFSCGICYCPVQREAHLTRCCGHHFCFECIEKVRCDTKPCPMCQETPLVVFPNKERQRDIKKLNVHCMIGQKRRDKKCEWKGELGQLAQHAHDQHGVILTGWMKDDRVCKPQATGSRSSPKPGAMSHGPPAALPNGRNVSGSDVLPPRIPPRRSSLSSFSSHRCPPDTNDASFIQMGYNRKTTAANCFRPIRKKDPSPPCYQPPVSELICRFETSKPCQKSPLQTRCKTEQSGEENVYLPGGRILKVYQRKDGTQYYNDHGKRQDIGQKHTVLAGPKNPTLSPTPKATPAKTVSRAQTSTSTQYVDLEGGRKLKVYERKDGSQFYNDHGRRQNITQCHTNTTSCSQPTARKCHSSPTVTTPAKISVPTTHVQLPGRRALKVYQRKDGTKYYNDKGRRKNL